MSRLIRKGDLETLKGSQISCYILYYMDTYTRVLFHGLIFRGMAIDHENGGEIKLDSSKNFPGVWY